MRNYNIMLSSKIIGSVEVTIEGLYYRFHCECCLSGEVMYQLKLVSGERRCDLGVLIPKGNKFIIDTKIPIKKIGEGDFEFIAYPRHPELKETFIPIRAEEPFAYIEKLENSFLTIINGESGILLSNDKN